MEVEQCEKTARDRKATATEQGPGKTTMDHHETDGISLTTPVSSSQDHDTFINPRRTHKNALTQVTMQRILYDKRSPREDQRVVDVK